MATLLETELISALERLGELYLDHMGHNIAFLADLHEALGGSEFSVMLPVISQLRDNRIEQEILVRDLIGSAKAQAEVDDNG